jgi:hypothetical protein
MDAIGTMYGELTNLETIRDEIEAGLSISLISMIEPGLLSRLLSGEAVERTHIRLWSEQFGVELAHSIFSNR